VDNFNRFTEEIENRMNTKICITGLRLSLLALVLFTTVSQAVMTSTDERLLQYNPPDPIALLGEQDAGSWFPDGSSTEWSAYRFSATGTIALTIGKPLTIRGSDIVDKALSFLDRNREEFGLGYSSLVLQSHSVIGNLTVVAVRPSVPDIRIWNSAIVLIFNRDQQLISVKGRGYGSDVIAPFSLTESHASISALSAYGSAVDSMNFEQWYLPVGDPSHITLHPIWRVALYPPEPDRRPVYYVSALDNSILASEETVINTRFEGTVRGQYNGLHIKDPAVIAPFPDLIVRLVNIGTVISSSDGSFATEVNNAVQQVRMNAELKGRWVSVDNFKGADAFYDNTVDVDTHPTIFWESQNSRSDERMLYVHTNIIHSHWKKIDPGYNALDYSMPAVCGFGERYDNAFWNGEGMYFGSGGEYANFAMFADIIYHEFGHGVTQHLFDRDILPYKGEPGALNEAWSDYFPCSLTNDSLVGEGGLVPYGGTIRRLDTNLIYPRDVINEVHADSRMTSSAMWKVRGVLGAKYCDSLFHYTRYLQGTDFLANFTDVLLTDDNDGDITNGSPNSKTLYEMFGKHGLGPGIFPNMEITNFAIADDNQNGADGNDDLLWERGETIRVEVGLQRNGTLYPPPAEDVTVRLYSDNAQIQIVNGVSRLGTFKVGDKRDSYETLLFKIADDAEVKFSHITLLVTDKENRRLVEKTVRIAVGVPTVLIVGNGSTEKGSVTVPMDSWFMNSLDSIGYVYASTNTLSPLRPLSDWMDKFNTLIWFTGNADDDLINNDDLTTLQRFHGRGGNIILTGQNIGRKKSLAPFLADYFGSEVVSDSIKIRWMRGIPGDSITDNTRYLITGDRGARNQNLTSALLPVNGGIAMMEYETDPISPVAAIRRKDPISGAKTIYMGFGLEAVSGLGGTTNRETLLQNIMIWFGKLEGVDDNPTPQDLLPAGLSLGAPYPNPFNGSITVPYILPSKGSATVNVIDISGRLVHSGIISPASRAGQISITTPSNWGSGVYYVTISSGSEKASRKVVLLR